MTSRRSQIVAVTPHLAPPAPPDEIKIQVLIDLRSFVGSENGFPAHAYLSWISTQTPTLHIHSALFDHEPPETQDVPDWKSMLASSGTNSSTQTYSMPTRGLVDAPLPSLPGIDYLEVFLDRAFGKAFFYLRPVAPLKPLVTAAQQLDVSRVLRFLHDTVKLSAPDWIRIVYSWMLVDPMRAGVVRLTDVEHRLEHILKLPVPARLQLKLDSKTLNEIARPNGDLLLQDWVSFQGIDLPDFPPLKSVCRSSVVGHSSPA